MFWINSSCDVYPADLWDEAKMYQHVKPCDVENKNLGLIGMVLVSFAPSTFSGHWPLCLLHHPLKPIFSKKIKERKKKWKEKNFPALHLRPVHVVPWHLKQSCWMKPKTIAFPGFIHVLSNPQRQTSFCHVPHETEIHGIFVKVQGKKHQSWVRNIAKPVLWLSLRARWQLEWDSHTGIDL